MRQAGASPCRTACLLRIVLGGLLAGGMTPGLVEAAPAPAVPGWPRDASEPASSAPTAQEPAQKQASQVTRRQIAQPPPGLWMTQRLAWERLVEEMEPLARRGAHLPSPKLRKHFRRKGIWEHPKFDPAKATARERTLLSPTGPAARREVNGPAGRAIWVEGMPPLPSDGGPRELGNTHGVARICEEAGRRCGLTCTFSPVLTTEDNSAQTALLRALRRLRMDHSLVLFVEDEPGALSLFAPGTEPRDAATRAPGGLARPDPTWDSLRLALDAAAALLPKGALRHEVQPAFRLTLGLRVPRQLPGRRQTGATIIAETLCRLGDVLPDRVHSAWTGTSAARKERADALARWLGIHMHDRPVAPGRAALERRYIRIHYRNRVFNIRQRPGDGAHIIRPLMVVIHYTGSLSLPSALHTLRARRLGTGPEAARQPESVSVGVPYVVDRDGTIYRLFDDDARFGRHTIGLNHSAMGIENVGDRRHPFTPAQLQANARLVEYAALRHPLRWLIGHREVYQMARTSYYLEAIPRYCSDKNDPAWKCLRTLRARLTHLGLDGPPPDRPMLRTCKDMLRYFGQVRRGARSNNVGRTP